MQIIAAFPCLGKTTIFKLNKDKCFDREFCESRSILGMTPEQKERFFDSCADIIRLQYEVGYYKIIFISEDDYILSKLRDLKKDITIIFPDAYNIAFMEKYKQRVIERSGAPWYERVITPELPNLCKRLDRYKEDGWDLRLVNHQHPYIEDVVKLPEDFILP